MLLTPALTIGLLSVTQLGPLTHVGSLTDNLRTPGRVAVAPDGTVLVTDPFYNHIARFDDLGTPLGTWPVPEGPIGIAAHSDGRYFVSLRDLPKVGIYEVVSSVLTRTGFLGEGNPPATFVGPTDIDVQAGTGHIFVVDSQSDQIYAFESDGDLAWATGVRGELSGEFMYPSAIGVDETAGRLIVADHDNFRLQIFDTDGMFQQSFGYRIKYLPDWFQEGWTVRTLGVAVDSGSRIYVADAMMSTVRIFDPTGVELGRVVDYGSAPGNVRIPTDLALSNDGARLYVVSTNTSSVEIYQTPTFAARRAQNAPDASLPEAGVGPYGTNACLYDAARVDSQRAVVGPIRDAKTGRKRGSGRLGDTSTAEGDTASAGRQSGYEGPHMIDASIICGRCHALDGQPGGYLGLVEGQGVLCMSCHNAVGQALVSPIHESDTADPYGTNPGATDGRGRSHAWGVSAVSASADSVGPTPGGEMERYLDASGNMKCSTCHDQHSGDLGAPYLRVRNNGDAMCKQCHAPRDKGPGEGGTHAVGFDYPGGVGEYPADNLLAPLVLKADLVECSTCHAVHYADSGGANNGEGDGMLLREGNDGTLCRICHSEHIGHTPGGSWQPTCIECHDVHDPGNANMSLVSATVHNETLDVDKTVVLTDRTGPNSFGDSGPVDDGICQVCHTATTYHMHDGSGAGHHNGMDCIGCHPHEAGFMPTGGDCTSCHSSVMDNGDGVPAGGRRAVVSEFPESDAHAHYGAELDNDACTVCHDMSGHMGGSVILTDPDDGSLYTFVKPENLTSDPDLSDFCAACHDSDGATRLGPSAQNPFGNGNVPPDAATKFMGTLQWDDRNLDECWFSEGSMLRQVNSHHDISDADQAWSGAKVECLNCHGAHNASASQPVADPFDTTAAWTGTDNDFCLSCHTGGTGPLDPAFPPGVIGPVIDTTDARWPASFWDGSTWNDILGGACIGEDCSSLRGIDSCDNEFSPWEVDYSWTLAAHGFDSKRGWNGYSGAPSYVLECMDCHDPHGSYTVTNTAGNPYMIRDFVDGTAYVDDGDRYTNHFNGPPWETFGIAREVVITIPGGLFNPDYGNATTGLCNVCHADWYAASPMSHDCAGCATCHAHGAAYQNYDFVGGDDDTWCLEGARSGQGEQPRVFEMDADGRLPPWHLTPSMPPAEPGASSGPRGDQP